MIDQDTLDLVTTDQLIETLRRRSCASLIAMVQQSTDQSQRKEIYYQDAFAALGLIEYCKQLIISNIKPPQDARDAPQDDNQETE